MFNNQILQQTLKESKFSAYAGNQGTHCVFACVIEALVKESGDG